MLFRTITVDGAPWRVAPSGLITVYNLDEFALVFTRDVGAAGTASAASTAETAPETRVTRYSPVGTRSREQSFAELSDDELYRLFAQSQPGATSPEARYAR